MALLDFDIAGGPVSGGPVSGRIPFSMEISRVVGLAGPKRARWLVLGEVLWKVVSPAAAGVWCMCLGVSANFLSHQSATTC